MTVLRNVPVDASKMNLFVAGPVKPVSVYEDGKRVEGAQKANEEGLPLWSVSLATFTEDGLVVLPVKVPSATEPKLELQAPVQVSGLVMSAYATNGGGIGQSFTAANISAAGKQG